MFNNTQKFISVASKAAPELAFYSLENDGENIHVYDAFIIRLLSQVLQLPYKVILTPDNGLGAELPDGNWSGITGMLRRSEADLSTGIGLNYKRSRAVKFSYPYLFSDITFMTDKPKPYPTSFAIIHPFTLALWILLTATILLFSCGLLIHVHGKKTLQNILFMVFGSLLEKSIDMQLRKTSIKIILGTWFVFTFFMINSYKAVLLSILTLPPLTGIRTIPELAKAADENSVKCYSYTGSVIPQIFLESENSHWRSIGKCMQDTAIASEDALEAFFKAPSGKAFITGRSFLKPYEESYFISEDSFFNSMYAFAVSQRFHHQGYLDEKIHRLFAAGLFQKIESDELFFLKLNNTHFESSDTGELKILQLQDLKGAFVVLFSGYVLSTVVHLIEIAVKRYFPKSNVSLNIKRKRISKEM